MHIDVTFRVYGNTLPGEHAYLLYAGLSHTVSDFHKIDGALRFRPINGDRNRSGVIDISPRSQLRLRIPTEQVAAILPLAGRSVPVGVNHTIRLGNPTVFQLTPATILSAKAVTFKNASSPEQFLTVARQRLDEMGIEGKPGIPLVEKGQHAGEPRRQIIRIKGIHIVGYALQVAGLTAEESIRLQELGLGGRTHMGCGFFVPYRPRES
jgi:CRISPR-associated protein Cas6